MHVYQVFLSIFSINFYHVYQLVFPSIKCSWRQNPKVLVEWPMWLIPLSCFPWRSFMKKLVSRWRTEKLSISFPHRATETCQIKGFSSTYWCIRAFRPLTANKHHTIWGLLIFNCQLHVWQWNRTHILQWRNYCQNWPSACVILLYQIYRSTRLLFQYYITTVWRLLTLICRIKSQIYFHTLFVDDDACFINPRNE